MIQPTYIMDHSVPANVTNGQYISHVKAEWAKHLNLPGVEEKHMQAFLEEHPCLLPFREIPLTHGDNHPLSSAVVTQPVLQGLKTKVPDFLYFTGNSGEITAVLIEIESPTKRWFTKGGQQTDELTQASNQIKSWKNWFADPINVQAFERDYMVRDYQALYNRTFKQEYILVIGRRCDITDPTLNKTRHHLQGPGETWMTYDRLQCSFHWDNAVTVRLDRSGVSHQFRAIHVPPMFKLGPHHYGNYHELSGIDDAVNSNAMMSSARKTFLINRLPYWRSWYTGNNGATVISGSDLAGE